MKIVCPNNPEHKRFGVTAHVSEDWIVNETGEFMDVGEGSSEVVHQPDAQDYYICLECRDNEVFTVAKVEE